MHPASFTPPLAYGGHEFIISDGGVAAYCWSCGQHCPLWAVIEGLWMVRMDRWCPARVRALPRPRRITWGSFRRLERRPPEMPGQLSIFDALEGS